MYYYIRRTPGFDDDSFWIQEFKSYTKSNINKEKWSFRNRNPVRMIRPKVIYSSSGKKIYSYFKTVISEKQILNSHELIEKIFTNIREW
jgi:hypothetical protein